jgi:hypothetical protein
MVRGLRHARGFSLRARPVAAAMVATVALAALGACSHDKPTPPATTSPTPTHTTPPPTKPTPPPTTPPTTATLRPPTTEATPTDTAQPNGS